MMMLNSGGGALCRSLLIGARSFATTVSSTSTSTSTSTTSDTTFISRSYSRSSSSSISSSTYNRLSTSSNNNNNPCIFNHHTFFTSRFYSTVIIDRPTTTTTSTSSSSNNNNNNLNNPSFRMRYQQNNKDRKDKNRKGKNDNKQDKEGKQEETTTTKERRILANGALRYSREELKTIGFLDFESNCFLLGDLDMIAQELKRYLAVHIGNGRVAHQMIRLHRLYEELLIKKYIKDAKIDMETITSTNPNNPNSVHNLYDHRKIVFFLGYFLSVDDLKMVQKLIKRNKELKLPHKVLVFKYLLAKSNSPVNDSKTQTARIYLKRSLESALRFSMPELKCLKVEERIDLIKAYSQHTTDEEAAWVLSSLLSERFVTVLLGDHPKLHDWLHIIFRDETQKYPMVVDREEVAALFRRSLHCLAQRMRDFAHYSPQTTYVPGTRTVEPLTPEKAQMKQDHLAVLAIQKKAMETIFAYFSKYGKDMRFLDYFIQNALNRHSVPLDELIRTLRDADDFESVYRVYDLCVENKIVISTPSAQIILERMLHERPNEIPKLIAYVMNSKPANFALLYIYNEMIGNYLVLDLFEQFLLTLVRPETQFLLYNYTNAMVSYYLIEGNYSQALAHLGRSAQHYNTPPHYTTSTMFEIYHEDRQTEFDRNIELLRKKKSLTEAEQKSLEELEIESNWNTRLFQHWQVNINKYAYKKMEVYRNYKELEGESQNRLSIMFNFINSESKSPQMLSIPRISDNDLLLKDAIQKASGVASVSKIFDIVLQQFLSIGILPFGDLLLRATLTIREMGGIQAYMDCRQILPPETRVMTFNDKDFAVGLQTNFNSTFSHLTTHEHEHSFISSPLVWNAVISTLGNTNQTERLLQVRRNFEGQYFIYTVAAIESFARHMYTLGRWSDPEILPFYSTANLHIPRSIRPQLIRLQQCEIEHLLSLNKINEAYSLFKTIKSPNNAILSTIFKVIEMKFGNNDNYESLSKKLINHITPIVVGTKQQNQNVVKEEEENQEKESNSTSTSTSTSTTTFRNQSFGITWGAFYRLFFERLLKNDRADLINHYISQHPEYFKGATVSKAVVHLMINAQLTPHDKIRVFLEHYTPLWTRCSDDLHACLLKAYEQLAPNDRDPSVLQKLESFKIYKEDPDSFDKHEIASIFYYNLNFIDTKFINNQVINTKAIHKEKYFEMRNLRQSIEDHQNMKDKKLNTSNSSM